MQAANRETGQHNLKPRLILRAEVQRRTGLARSTLAEMRRRKEFPKPVKLTPRLVAWLESEVDEWIAAKIATRETE